MQVFTLRIRRVKHLRHIAIFVVFGIPRVWRLSPWQQAEEALYVEFVNFGVFCCPFSSHFLLIKPSVYDLQKDSVKQ